MDKTFSTVKANFGTLPVFLTAISTILGAIMFLRFGFAVGSVGFMGTLLIILIGHLVTISTAMALAEIATNQKVEGGGEYFIISRSFGVNIGAAIGIALYMSQAISVAFYVIAFGESFEAIKPWIESHLGYIIYDNRLFTIPALLVLIWLMVTKGANLGMKALYIVVTILAVSLILFFLGSTQYSEVFDRTQLFKGMDSDKGFFYVFAIIFPAFTGMTAGVGLSGDLKDPKKSIPLGTLAATVFGMIVYIFIAYKLASSASPEDLANDQLIMGKIALWGPIIPIGLAAATVSSALGSFMVAPRTLQAIGGDKVFPNRFVNFWVSKGAKKNNEPRNATILTSVIALIFVLMGDVNAVAEIISMFFMVTYGALCLISFMQHFAADPSYRPSFKSKWYLSLLGAIMCIYLMFKINTTYAMAAIAFKTLLYF
ncbi:MAG TPA: amino acid permease, partial [Flavobacteriaceae bacterium]|nr:amino acid permease [Flavobacteriaceae bacterium]